MQQQQPEIKHQQQRQRAIKQQQQQQQQQAIKQQQTTKQQQQQQQAIKQQQQTTEEQKTADRQKQQISYEDATILIEEFILVSVIQYFVSMTVEDFSRWGYGIWTDRSLMGDPLYSQSAAFIGDCSEILAS
jgi:uncharacterized membrane protein YheB (UPF0754 family)